jgi:hypothetical protein
MTDLPDPKEIAPGQPVEVDLLRPEDAPGVAALFRAVYGEGYPQRDYLEPERLAAANAEARIVSSVGRTPGGDIVAHNALFRSAPHPATFESGAGVVLPSYRQGNLFTKLAVHGVEHGAPAAGAEMVFGEPVCNHVYSQKMVVGLGWIETALEVDLMPAAAYQAEHSARGRVSALLNFNPPLPRRMAAHLPEAYRAELEEIYGWYRHEERDLLPGAEAPPAGEPARVEAQHYPSAGVSRLAAWSLGPGFPAAWRAAEEEAAGQGSQVVQAWLPLGRPWVGAAVEELRSRGYFFGGLLPRWMDSDALLMQRLAASPDWEGIQLAFDTGRRLAEMARADWERAAAG